MFNVLIVEDDVKLNQLMCAVLEKKGYKPIGVYNAVQALDEFYKGYIDLIISDIMMPKMDGFEFAKTIREAHSNVPILFVTAKDSFEDKQRGFKLGVDDYMVKPIDVNEMILRVEALMRRAKITNEHRLTVGSTELDYDTLTVKTDGETVTLPQKEFYILFKLLSYPNRIFTRTQLMDEFWGAFSESYERTVDVHVTRIRDKFKNNSDFELVTVRGLGYKAVKKG